MNEYSTPASAFSSEQGLPHAHPNATAFGLGVGIGHEHIIRSHDEPDEVSGGLYLKGERATPLDLFLAGHRAVIARITRALLPARLRQPAARDRLR